MKVLNLCCASGHGFEGWFGSDDDFTAQLERGLVACPLCGDLTISRRPSAPRLNLSGARAPAGPAPSMPPAAAGAGRQPPAGMPPELQAQWMKLVHKVLSNTEDVGERFPEEARRIHYGEAPERGIRGQATPEQRAELADEGIEVVQLPIPDSLKGPLQ